jgi:hypothetical protein
VKSKAIRSLHADGLLRRARGALGDVKPLLTPIFHAGRRIGHVLASEALLYPARRDPLPLRARPRDTYDLRMRVTPLLGDAEQINRRAFG